MKKQIRIRKLLSVGIAAILLASSIEFGDCYKIKAEEMTVEAEDILNAGEESSGEPANNFKKRSSVSTFEIKKRASIKIEGWQISQINEGFRTVYTLEDRNEDVAEVGLLYSIEDCLKYAPNDEPITHELLNYQTDSGDQVVEAFAATPKGLVDKSDNKEKYVMTLKYDNVKTKAFLSVKFTIRPYIKLSNGEYEYGEQENMTIYDLADCVYRESKMPNLEGHEYLYTDILSLFNPEYVKIEWDGLVSVYRNNY